MEAHELRSDSALHPGAEPRLLRARTSPRSRSTSRRRSPQPRPSTTPWSAAQSTPGYLPPTEITARRPRPGAPGVLPKTGPNNPRLAVDIRHGRRSTWSIDYYPYNFNSTGDTGNAGPIFKQLYFRQAYQHLVDQTLIVQRLDRGYGAPNYGPVPVEPENTLISSAEKTNPYPYSATAATALLKAHGWKVVPNGVSTCQKPGTRRATAAPASRRAPSWPSQWWTPPEQRRKPR